MFAFAPRRSARRPSLTPMIDVVFLLLVFFMLAARFGQDGAVAITLAGQGEAYSGPPRLIEVRPDGQRLNGRDVDEAALIDGIGALMANPADTIVLRAGDGATLQHVVDVMDLLGAQGYGRLVLVE